jgi:hypothetical protein
LSGLSQWDSQMLPASGGKPLETIDILHVDAITLQHVSD